MNARANLERPGRTVVLVAATLATVIALGIVAVVTDLFQSRGMPMAELAAAERACGTESYLSDREKCMREQVATARGSVVARQ